MMIKKFEILNTWMLNYYEYKSVNFNTTQPDPDGRKFGDKHSVAVMKDGITCGHLPKEISSLAKFFIIHEGEIMCNVTGTKRRS